MGALAGVCALPAWSQSPRDADSAPPRSVVSIHELSIPDSARRNYAKSREEILAHNPACAITHLRKAIEQFPDYYEAYYLLGIAYMTLHQPAEAEAALRKSVSLSAERFPQALVALASVYSNAGRFAEAEPLAAQAVELDDSWYSHYELARARLQLGRVDDALTSARFVVRDQPDYAQGRLLLALVYARRRDYPAAIEQIEAYLRLDSDLDSTAQVKIIRLRDELARAVAPGALETATTAPQPQP